MSAKLCASSRRARTESYHSSADDSERMEQQNEFLFTGSENPRLGIPRVDDPLVADMARIWGLPIGQRVRIQLKVGENLPMIAGRLEVTDAPFDSRTPLSLFVSGYVFSGRSIASWSILDPT